MNKKTITIILIILVVALGIIAYVRSSKEETVNEPAVSERLNIDAICEGSLIYMTFPDGASAEKFVAECKEGKHPEVIEKFKADMNVGDGENI